MLGSVFTKMGSVKSMLGSVFRKKGTVFCKMSSVFKKNGLFFKMFQYNNSFVKNILPNKTTPKKRSWE